MSNKKEWGDQMYYFITDEGWNDIWEHATLTIPKHNAYYKINVSGLTFKDLANVLRFLADCIEASADGKRVFCNERIPLSDETLEYYRHWSWDEDCENDEFPTCYRLTNGTMTKDGKTEIFMNPDIQAVTEENRTIDQFLRRKHIVTTSQNGQTVKYEYPED